MPQQDRRKGRSCFFSGRMQGDEREDPGSGIRRHLPSEAVRTGNPANDGMPKAGPDGPVRGNRSVGSGRYGWAGIRPAASRGTVGGASGRRRKPYDRQLRVSGGESANAPAEGATAGTVSPFVRRDRNTLSTARADNTSSRNESRPFRNPPRRGGMPAAGVAYRGAACAGLLPESGDFAEQTFFDAVK